jgi:hypothetical protein
MFALQYLMSLLRRKKYARVPVAMIVEIRK